MVGEGVFERVDGARLCVGHSHNSGDACIGAPRSSYNKTACRNLGDVVTSLRKSHRTGKPPVVILLTQIHGWSERANAMKNPQLKHLMNPHVWRTQMAEDGTPGMVYKDRHDDPTWYGADGVPGGRAVQMFRSGAYPPAAPPVMLPRRSQPFSQSAIASTKKVLIPTHSVIIHDHFYYLPLGNSFLSTHGPRACCSA